MYCLHGYSDTVKEAFCDPSECTVPARRRRKMKRGRAAKTAIAKIYER